MLVLIDAFSQLYRAFYAVPELLTKDGHATGAIHGFLLLFQVLERQFPSDHMVVVFDAPGKSFRSDLYQQYKINRPAMPEQLRQQISPLKEILSALGLPLLSIDGIEADDAIGAVSVQAAAAGMDVIIVSSDKDMAQLVNQQVKLFNPTTKRLMDRDAIKERFGVYPEQIADYLALVGDSSDNIPGLPGCGPVTATRWLQQHRDLDEILAQAGKLPGKVAKALCENPEERLLAKKLATILTHLEQPVSLSALRRSKPATETVQKLAQRYELRQLQILLERFSPEQENSAYTLPPAATESENLCDEETLQKWIAHVQQAPLFALDTETDSLHPALARLVGISFCCSAGKAAYLPLAHNNSGGSQISLDRALALLKPLLEDPQQPKLFHNLKFDYAVFSNHGIELAGCQHDSMLQSYLLRPHDRRHSMDTLAERELGVRLISYAEVTKGLAKEDTFASVPLEQAGPYAAEDADITWRLHQHQWPQLQQLPALKTLYQEIELPLAPVLARMEQRGVAIDSTLLKQQQRSVCDQLANLEKEAHNLVGLPFNLSSPQQLQQILFVEQGLPVRRKTPKGKPSTAEDVLEELALDYPLPRLILEHRALSKLNNTYLEKLPRAVNQETGRIHTSYQQTIAATGRLSSTDPNLQNIPIRGAEGKRIRQAFIARPGYRLLTADYSQIELRLMAYLSGDQGLLQAFAQGQDVHRATAADIFGLSIEDIDAEKRRAAKAINFGLIYGMSPFGLARQLQIGRAQADLYIQRYFARYPGVLEYMEKTRMQAREQGFVETLFGRRLPLPEIHARQHARREAAERSAINAPVQGSAADIIKKAMIRIDAALQSQPIAWMIMQVHDELVFEVTAEYEAELRALVRQHMVSAGTPVDGLIVDIGSGDNWQQAH